MAQFFGILLIQLIKMQTRRSQTQSLEYLYMINNLTRILISWLSLSFVLAPGTLTAQSVFDDVTNSGPATTGPSDLADERIERISPSRRIFIISNNARSFAQGDFISILQNEELIARALVAKLAENGLAGIKIVKIYNLDLWKPLRSEDNIQVLRGDDSYYQKLMNDEELPDEMSLIEDEQDLFNESTFLEDDLLLEDKSNRILRNDHLVSFYLGFYEGIDNAENATTYQQFNASYAFQVEDNIFVEGSYGRNLINDYPTGGLDTLLQNFTFRAKYVIKAPYFSFVLPYVGYQLVTGSSDEAGVPGDNTTPQQLQRELDLVEAQKQSRPVFGVTIIKRLVPGWFIRASFGRDQAGVGLALEF